MLLHLFSDANYNLLGFNASFRASPCPGGCGGRGACDPQGHCRCPPGWGGPDCSRPPCQSYCRSPGGVCNQVGPPDWGEGGNAHTPTTTTKLRGGV